MLSNKEMTFPLERQIVHAWTSVSLQVKCLELEEVLLDQGYDQDEIAVKVQAYRKMLHEKEAANKAFQETDEFGRAVYKDSHAEAAAQKEKNAKLKSAFGITTQKDY